LDFVVGLTNKSKYSSFKLIFFSLQISRQQHRSKRGFQFKILRGKKM